MNKPKILEIKNITYPQMKISAEMEFIKPYEANIEMKFKVCSTLKAKDELDNETYIRFLKMKKLNIRNFKEYLYTLSIPNFTVFNYSIVTLTFDHTYSECKLDNNTPIGFWFNLKHTGLDSEVETNFNNLQTTLFPELGNTKYFENDYFTLKA